MKKLSEQEQAWVQLNMDVGELQAELEEAKMLCKLYEDALIETARSLVTTHMQHVARSGYDSGALAKVRTVIPVQRHAELEAWIVHEKTRLGLPADEG